MRVLLVEDDDATEVAVRSLLPAGRYTLDRVATPSAAQRALQVPGYDVALVDYFLPGRNGIELIREAVAAGSPVPMVLLTGHDDPALDLEALRAGAADFLDKGRLDARVLERTLRYVVERQRGREALRRLQKAVETMHVGVSITDLSGRVVYVNPAEAEMHGFTVDELIGRHGRELSPREDWQPMGMAELRDVRRWRRERWRTRRDGSRFPVQLISDAVLDDHGNPVGLVTTCEDITERREADRALRSSEERYRSLVEAAREVIFTLSPEGAFVSLNPAFERLTGWGREPWVGRSFAALVHPDDIGDARQMLERLQRGESVPPSERRVLTAAGDWVVTEVTVTPLPGPDGSLGSVLGVARDVTSRKRGELRQALQLAVSRVLAESPDLAAAAVPLLLAIGRGLGFDVGRLWVAEPVLSCAGTWRSEEVRTPALDARGDTPTRLVSWAWGSQQPAWIRDLTAEAEPPGPALEDGMRGAFAVPVISGSGRVGVIEFYARRPRPADSMTLLLLQDLGRRIGLFLDRVRAMDALRESEERFRSVAESAPDGIVLADRRANIVFANPAAIRMLGGRVPLPGRALASIVAPEHRAELEATLAGLRQGLPAPRLGSREELRAARPDGSSFPVEVSLSAWSAQGETAFAAIVRDVSERRMAEDALRESAERYELAVQGTNDGIWDWDLLTDHIYYSPRWEQILGYGGGELLPRPEEWMDRIHPDDRERAQRKIAAHVAGEIPSFEDEHRLLHRDGTWRWVLCRGYAVPDDDGVPHRMAGALTDVTDRRAYDPLTGLPNRALFGERLAQACERARTKGDGLFAVLYLDLDGFKAVNDTAGHRVGDRLLVGTARRLEACVRPGDVVARLGGDEFAVLLHRIAGPADATRVADRILEQLESPPELAEHALDVGCSIGIAFHRPDLASAEELLDAADAAMYRAKSQGKGRYEVFDERLRAQAAARREIQRELHAATERDLALVLQPVQAFGGAEVVGCRALLRWRSPSRGWLTAEEFTGLAEDTGLLAAWRGFVIAAACGAAEAPGSPWIAIRLSARQLREPGVATALRDELARRGIGAERLRVMADEAAFGALPAAARRELVELRELGVRVLVDEFGRDDTSLRRLLDLPVDGLCLDPALAEPVQARLLRSVVTAARAADLEVLLPAPHAGAAPARAPSAAAPAAG